MFIEFFAWLFVTVFALQLGVHNTLVLWSIWLIMMGLFAVRMKPDLNSERTPLIIHASTNSHYLSTLVVTLCLHIVTLWFLGQHFSEIVFSTIAVFALLLGILSYHWVKYLLLLPVLAISNLLVMAKLGSSFDYSKNYNLAGLLACLISSNTLSFLVSLKHYFMRHDQIVETRTGYDASSFLSYYTFWWVKPVLTIANTEGFLSMSELPSLANADNPNVLEERFWRLWETGGDSWSPFEFLVTVIFSIQPNVFRNSFFHGILFLLCMFIDPLLLNHLLNLRDSYSESVWVIAALSASMLIRVSAMEISYYESTRVANNVRTVLALAIFKVSLGGSIESTRHSAGLLTNLMATDTEKLGQFSWGVFALAQWTFAVISLPFVIYFLHQLVGRGAFLGIGVLFIGIFVYLRIARKLETAQKLLQECRDHRSEVMKQVLRSAKVTKLERLEKMWLEKLGKTRRNELDQIWSVQYLSALNNLAGALGSLAVPLSMFSWYTLVDGKELDAATAFSALAWIAQMQWSIVSLPFIFNAWSALKPSLERIATFMKSSASVKSVQLNCKNPKHEFKGIYLHCESKGLTTSLDVNPGELIIIVGATGSGKSRLLSSFISPAEGDDSCVHGEVALVLQTPFLMNASVKDNILFGLPFDEGRLQDALRRTELEIDMEALPRGILTMVGPSGVQLSGGQKARVCLARALYSDADCYLLDDILSAVDKTTGNRIWENVIAFLKRKSKSTILITHQTQFLNRSEVDKVVIMENGQVQAAGKFHELKLSKHISSCLSQIDSTGTPVSPSDSAFSISSGSKVDHMPCLTLDEIRLFLRPLLLSFSGRSLTESIIDDDILVHFSNPSTNVDGMEETLRKGGVRFSDFSYYLKQFGSLANLMAVAFVVAFTSILSTVWISFWTDDKDGKLSQLQYLLIYAGLGFLQACFACGQTILLSLAALRASSAIHNHMVKKLLGAPLSYFDSHSSGSILNRFFQDLGSIDSSVPQTMLDQMSKFFSITGQFVLICFVTPLVMFILPLVLWFYTFIIRTFRIAARDTRRIESAARSPVYDLFSDVLNGLETIQCYGAQRRFEVLNRKLVAQMSAAKVGNEAVNKWAQALTVQVSCLFYFCAGFVGVIFQYRDIISVSTLGLVLLNAAVLQRALMDFVMGLTSLETNFVSVERIADFTKISNESDELRFVISDEWLNQGCLELSSVRMRYSINRSNVLNGISLTFAAGSKVAVIGRTGCGKSSLLGALAQLYPLSDGCIKIDNVDIRKISQTVLQKIIRVIPQDTVLFDGSIRENILVGHHMSDVKIWEALEIVQLKSKVIQIGGLDSVIKFGGAEFSAGERQLLCLARALSAGIPRILLCDEVTSNVDLTTDDLVLRAILNLDASVIMVLHRLDSLRRFDKILMLKEGNVVAYGDANELIDHNVEVQTFMMQELK